MGFRSAIIITACASLISFKPYFELAETSPPDAMAFAITCAATVCSGAKWGLAVGIATSVGVLAYRATRADVAPVASACTPELCTLQITGWLNFGNAAAVERQISHLVARSGAITRCIVHLDPGHTSDAIGHHMLAGLRQRIGQTGVELIIAPRLKGGPIAPSRR